MTGLYLYSKNIILLQNALPVYYDFYRSIVDRQKAIMDHFIIIELINGC
jgi:hypothetical protein